MSQLEEYDVLVLGSGAPGKLLAWTLASQGRRTAVVERRYVGGSCPICVNLRIGCQGEDLYPFEDELRCTRSRAG
jgi:pyruvate/2-oxoglutarate dehydrogenase complex dihydrolipoamide dehydrogenase (E3) component